MGAVRELSRSRKDKKGTNTRNPYRQSFEKRKREEEKKRRRMEILGHGLLTGQISKKLST
jgi:hypothetical protein